MNNNCMFATSIVNQKRSKKPLQLQYEGGPLLANCEVFTIFWGKKWQTKIHKAFMDSVNEFFNEYLKSSDVKELNEYNTKQIQIEEGKHIGTILLEDPTQANLLTDSMIRKTLKQKIKKNLFPKPTKNTLYFFFIEEGVIVKKGHDVSCKAFCGYHDVTSQGTYYAVIPYPTSYNCRGNGSITDALTILSSHELIEAITDPLPEKGWYARGHGEIADICEGYIKQSGKFAVQKVWSNKRGTCT